MSQITLPSGLVAEDLQELTGIDQDTLCNKQLIKSNRAINVVLSRRTATIDGKPVTEETVRNLLSGDRAVLLMELRRASLGDEFEFTHTCDNKDCRKESNYSLKLDDEQLKRRNYPNGNKRDHEFKLPKSGHEVHFELLNGVGEEVIAEAARKSGNVTPNTVLMARNPRIKRPDVSGFVPFDANTIGLQDLTALRTYIKTLEGGIDTTVEVECEFCEHSNKINLVNNASFFFPAAT